MSFELVESLPEASRILEEIAEEPSIALDLEAAGFHRYSDRICLIQITTASGRDLIFDPIAFDAGPLFKPFLESEDRRILMHGSDYDLRLLDRDYGIHLTRLTDTQAAAQILGESAIGLSALLEKYLGVKLAKKFQRADWAQRPLSEEMLDYAAKDTRYLHELVGRLHQQLEEASRTHWASEEYERLETIRSEDTSSVDPVTRVKGARKLPPRVVTRLREALAWRNDVAKRLDRAPFRVASDQVLIDVSMEPPSSTGEFASRKGTNPRMAKKEGGPLIERLRAIDALSDEELVPYPRVESDGRGRPPPEIEEVANRLKNVRNKVAEELGLDRGTLLPNAVVLETAWQHPKTMDALREVPGLKRWQIEAVGEALLAALGG